MVVQPPQLHLVSATQKQERTRVKGRIGKEGWIDAKEEGAGEANAVSLASVGDSRRCGFSGGGRRRSGPTCARTKTVSLA